MPHIELSETNSNCNWLLCPACRSTYLNHGTVTVFEREGGRKDAPSYSVVVDGSSISRENGSGNPSSRRDGIAIRFWCEGCRVISELTIAQHKGETEMDWRTVGHRLDHS